VAAALGAADRRQQVALDAVLVADRHFGPGEGAAEGNQVAAI
jgi:hypothetical protein